MTKHKQFMQGNCPEPLSSHPSDDTSCIGLFFKYLGTYIWISGNPDVYKQLKGTPGCMIYRIIGWCGWIALALFISLGLAARH